MVDVFYGPAFRRALAELHGHLTQWEWLARQDDGGPDVDTWKTIMAEYVEAGSNWLDTPWLTAEFYFYR